MTIVPEHLLVQKSTQAVTIRMHEVIVLQQYRQKHAVQGAIAIQHCVFRRCPRSHNNTQNVVIMRSRRSTAARGRYVAPRCAAVAAASCEAAWVRDRHAIVNSQNEVYVIEILISRRDARGMLRVMVMR